MFQHCEVFFPFVSNLLLFVSRFYIFILYIPMKPGGEIGFMGRYKRDKWWNIGKIK